MNWNLVAELLILLILCSRLVNSYDMTPPNKTVHQHIAKEAVKVWAFNYLSPTDSPVNMFNLTPSLYTLELRELTPSQITDTVSRLINNTKQ